MQNSTSLKTSLNDLSWTHSFTDLGESFYSVVKATPLTNPRWVHVNQDVASLMGLTPTALQTEDHLALFSGQQTIHHIPSIAMVYAGHQFGGYSAQLGDGRGLLIGQLNTDEGNVDLHLKGAGKTPYSRFGDGRAVLRSSIREYVAGEAMHHLGIASSRALCITTSDDSVMRETMETAAMVTRVARTHIRFGHFEYFHYQGRHKELKQLADHVIEQHLPEAINQDNAYEQLLQHAVEKTAKMIAQWQSVGFAHGVMNTDNMSIIGETLDYGPYGFLDDYEPGFICNHSDHQGRYAFDQQPSMGLWNLNALAHALSSLIDSERINALLATYEPTIVEHFALLMRKKFGWLSAQQEDHSICSSILQLMGEDKVDYTIFFRLLSRITTDTNNNSVESSDDKNNPSLLRSLFTQESRFDQWLARYHQRLVLEKSNAAERQERMLAVNPKYILRNYLLQKAIDKAQQSKDYTEIDTLMTLIKKPFEEHPEYEAYASPPPVWGKHLPISCSS